MILVTMTLHSAITGQPTELVSIRIVNDGTGTPTLGNYTFRITGKNSKQVLKQGAVKDWPRKSKTALALLQRVINTAYPKGDLGVPTEEGIL